MNELYLAFVVRPSVRVQPIIVQSPSTPSFEQWCPIGKKTTRRELLKPRLGPGWGPRRVRAALEERSGTVFVPPIWSHGIDLGLSVRLPVN